MREVYLSMIQAREVSIAVQGKMVEQQRTKGKGLLRKNTSFVVLFVFTFYGKAYKINTLH